jgi:hypothetical protein
VPLEQLGVAQAEVAREVYDLEAGRQARRDVERLTVRQREEEAVEV